MQSAIFKGWIRHRRHVPTSHSFIYKVFMMYLDLSELDQVFKNSRLWSVERRTLARFKRSDFFGDPNVPLDTAVRQRVQEETGVYPEGPVRLLANLRYFGFIMNPVTCYYCFDKQENLQAIVAEVNNTPWDERHSYVLNCDPSKQHQRITFDKTFHVSPFNPMDVHYAWRSNLPERNLYISMQNWRDDQVEFDAMLALTRKEITPARLRALIWQYPFMTMQVVIGIYWQAVKLFFKRVPVHDHPIENGDEIKRGTPNGDRKVNSI
jgi:uncharacterized protein